MVRHQFLVLAFGGSNPSSPAMTKVVDFVDAFTLNEAVQILTDNGIWVINIVNLIYWGVNLNKVPSNIWRALI